MRSGNRRALRDLLLLLLIGAWGIAPGETAENNVYITPQLQDIEGPLRPEYQDSLLQYLSTDCVERQRLLQQGMELTEAYDSCFLRDLLARSFEIDAEVRQVAGKFYSFPRKWNVNHIIAVYFNPRWVKDTDRVSLKKLTSYVLLRAAVYQELETYGASIRQLPRAYRALRHIMPEAKAHFGERVLVLQAANYAREVRCKFLLPDPRLASDHSSWTPAYRECVEHRSFLTHAVQAVIKQAGTHGGILDIHAWLVLNQSDSRFEGSRPLFAAIHFASEYNRLRKLPSFPRQVLDWSRVGSCGDDTPLGQLCDAVDRALEFSSPVTHKELETLALDAVLVAHIANALKQESLAGFLGETIEITSSQSNFRSTLEEQMITELFPIVQRFRRHFANYIPTEAIPSW